jgi:hypothetical protein
MAAATRIRGQEAQIQIVVDGDLKGSSFAKVTDFTLTPQDEIMTTSFLGETEDDFDYIHRGYDFSFKTHEASADINNFLRLCVERELNALPHPDIVIIVQVRYRDIAGTTDSIVLEQVRMKLDSKSISGAKDYVANSFSGKCRVAS